MKRKEHVCRTIFKKISRNLVAHLRPAAYVLVLFGWAALDFVCCSNTRRTSTLCVPDLQNFGQFWKPRTLGGAFLGGLVHHVQHQHRILPTLNWGGIHMHSPIVSHWNQQSSNTTDFYKLTKCLDLYIFWLLSIIPILIGLFQEGGWLRANQLKLKRELLNWIFKLGDNSKYFEQSKSIQYIMRHLVVKSFLPRFLLYNLALIVLILQVKVFMERILDRFCLWLHSSKGQKN